MDQLVSVMLLLFFIIIAIGAVLTIGNDIIEKAETASHMQEAESLMKNIRNNIYQVVSEGNGSARKIPIAIKSGYYEANSPKNSIIYYTDGIGTMDYLSRKNDMNVYTIIGTDAGCSEDDNYLYMYNSRINATFQKKGSPLSWEAIDTSNNILILKQRDVGTSITFANTSVSIDDSESSSYGNGFSEILKKDDNMPFCTVHFFVNSDYGQYDIYYTLFSGADFIVQEVYGSLSGKSITSSYAFHINNTDFIRVNETTNLSTDDIETTYVPSKTFISSQANSTVFGMIFAGSRFFNISLNTSYGNSHYQMKLAQSYENNRVILAFTNGTWQNIDNHLEEISSDRIIGSQFGDFPVQSHEKTRNIVASIMNDLNMTNTLRWGTGNYELIITNLGKINNITNIRMELR